VPARVVRLRRTTSPPAAVALLHCGSPDEPESYDMARVCRVSQPIIVKAAVLKALRDAETYLDSLATLRRQVEEEVGAVTAEIGGTASAADVRAVAQLQASIDELDTVIGLVRAAVADGRRFAESL
jgi:hypothetical protein